MEHRNSTIVTSSRPLATSAKDNIGTVAHEFFHAWNVERIRPASLEPFDFTSTNMSGELWFAEGFTSYYTDLTLVRAGILSMEEYLQNLSGLMNYVLLSPGSKLHSPVEMSYQAPFVDAAVSVDPVNRGNTFISYYSYGELLGLALDLRLRTEFEEKSLDGFMRFVWERYGESEIPYTLSNLQAALAEYSGSREFAETFFAKHIHGNELPDMKELFSRLGIALEPANQNRGSLGRAYWQEKNDQLVLGSYTLRGTPLYEAGLDKGDVLLQLNGQAVNSKAMLDSLLAGSRAGDEVALLYSRFGEERKVTLELEADPELKLVPQEKAGKKQLRLREEWLESKVK